MADVKVLPSSKESEEALLGAVITGGEIVYEKIVGWIRESDAFYYTDNKIIWETITDLFKNHEPVDEVTIVTKLNEKHPKNKLAYYITGLRDQTPTVANAESYAKIIWEKHIQRQTSK